MASTSRSGRLFEPPVHAGPGSCLGHYGSFRGKNAVCSLAHNGSGRYFPFYWLYHAVLYGLFSWHIAPHYLVQSVLFLVAALVLCHLYLKAAGPGVMAVLFAASVFVSTPNVETLYTIGKPEPLLYFFVVWILLFSYSLSTDPTRLSMLKLAGISVCFAFAMWSKETAEVMLVFGVTGIALAIIASRQTSGPSPAATFCRSRYLWILVSIAVGFAITKAPYLLVRPPAGAGSGKTYTDYAITQHLIIANAAFYLLQQPDVICLGLLALAVLFIVWRRV